MSNDKKELYDDPAVKEENVYLYDDEDDESFHTTDIDLDDSFFNDPLPAATAEKAAAVSGEEAPAEPEPAPFAAGETAAASAGEESAAEEPFEPGFEPDFEVSDESYDFYTAGEEYEDAPEDYDVYAEEQPDRRKKGSFLPLLIIILLLILGAAAVASVLIVRRNNSLKEEAALEELARSAVEDVSNGLYDQALQKADKLYYTSGYSDKIRLKWDDERTTLIDYIEGERKRSESQDEAPAAVQEPAAEETAENAAPSKLSLDECIEMAKNELPFSNFDVIIQDQILYIAFWQAGYGDQAATAKQNRGEALAAWNSMQDDIRSANNHMRIVLNENGHENYDLIYALLNDIDTEYTLYEVMNGLVTYAAVR